MLMNENLVCWKCGVAIDLPMPLGRESECRHCHAQLHVCRLCEFYNPGVAEQCEEPVADYVKEKERANFCDYFKPIPDAYKPVTNNEADQSVNELNALFGLNKETQVNDMTEAEKAKKELDDLFKK